jgi:hypothetical protein
VLDEVEAVYADADEWWAAKWTHGARRPLEGMPTGMLQAFVTEVDARLAPFGWPMDFTSAGGSCACWEQRRTTNLCRLVPDQLHSSTGTRHDMGGREQSIGETDLQRTLDMLPGGIRSW